MAQVSVLGLGASGQLTLDDAGLGSLMTGAFVEYCRRAAEAGEGGEDIAALIRRMREAPAE